MRLEINCSFHDIVWANHPAHAPTSHCISLCNTVHDDALVGNFRNECWHRTELVLAVREVLVNFIGNDPDAVLNCPLSNGSNFFWRIHGTTWVVGRNEQQHFGARRARTFKLFHGYSETRFFSGVNNNGHSPGQGDGFGVGSPKRSRANDFITWVAQGGEGNEHCMLATVSNHYLAGLACKAAVAQGFHRNGFTQLWKTRCRRIAVVLHVVTRFGSSLNNVGWRGKIGFAGTKANDVFALRFEGFRLRVDGKGG